MTGKCCKCEKYHWLDPQEVVWEDPADGKGYCVFHAPTGEKRKQIGVDEKFSISEFNDHVYSRLNKAISDQSSGEKAPECDFSGTTFPGDISFQKYDKRNPFPTSAFMDAIFYGEVDFSGVVFAGHCYFVNVTFLDRALFISCAVSGQRIRMLDIKAESMEKLCFLRPDLDIFAFVSCKWPNRLGVETYSDTTLLVFRTCEEVYRGMKQRAAEEHDQPQISHWHYREKMIKLKELLLSKNCNALIEAVDDTDLCKNNRARAWWEIFRALPWRLRVSLLFLYWTCSGFGERSGRAALCLVALVTATLMVLIGLKVGETWPGWQAPWRPDLGKSMEILVEWMHCMPLVKLDYQPAPELPIIGPIRFFLTGLFQVAITIQAALFALAVRNRFRR